MLAANLRARLSALQSAGEIKATAGRPRQLCSWPPVCQLGRQLGPERGACSPPATNLLAHQIKTSIRRPDSARRSLGGGGGDPLGRPADCAARAGHAPGFWPALFGGRRGGRRARMRHILQTFCATAALSPPPPALSLPLWPLSLALALVGQYITPAMGREGESRAPAANECASGPVSADCARLASRPRCRSTLAGRRRRRRRRCCCDDDDDDDTAPLATNQPENGRPEVEELPSVEHATRGPRARVGGQFFRKKRRALAKPDKGKSFARASGTRCRRRAPVICLGAARRTLANLRPASGAPRRRSENRKGKRPNERARAGEKK